MSDNNILKMSDNNTPYKRTIYTLIFTLLTILVLPQAAAQSWNMVNGDTVHIDACSAVGGTIYDNGGPNGNYTDGFRGWVVIEATDMMSITLSGNYQLEGCCDYISVWDGTPASGQQLWNNCGSGTLNLTATSGRMTIQFTSDGSVTNSGFALEWGRDGWGTNGCTSGITQFAATAVTATTATLQWTAAVASLKLDYGQGEQTVSGGTTTLTGLNPNTLYTAMLYAEGEQANPCCVARTTFRTGCGPMAAPMVERFDDLTVDQMPTCWSMGKNFDDATLFPRVTTAAAQSGSKSLMLSSGDNTTATHFGMVMTPGITTAIAGLSVHVSLRSNMANAKVEIGVCDTVSGLYSYYGFTPVDTLTVAQSGQWYEYTVPLTEYVGDGTRLAFRMIQGMQPSGGCIVYIDNLLVENCGVDGLQVSNIGADELTVSWSYIGNPTVDLTVSGGGTVASYVGVTSPYRVTGLTPETHYTLTLTPRCGGAYGEAKSVSTSTLDGDTLALQYCQDFESGWPATLRRAEIYDNHPQIVNSTSYNLRFRSYGANRSMVVLPRTGPNTAIDGLRMMFTMRPDYNGDGVVVGVIDYPGEMSTFTPVDTVTSTNSWQQHSVSLAGYAGSGRYIAIRGYTPTGNSRYVYLDNLAIGNSLLTGLAVGGRSHNSVTLMWDIATYDGECDIVVEYGPGGFTLGSGTTVSVSASDTGLVAGDDGLMHYTVTGLDAATTYQFAVYRDCGEAVCSPQRVTATTYLRNYAVPYCDNFDGVTGDNYVYLADWGRPSMFDGRPCLWQYSDAPTPGRVLEMHSYGPLANGRQHSTAVLPRLDYSGQLNDLTVSFYAKFNSSSYTAYLEVGVIADPADESTFTPVDTVYPPYQRFEHFAVSLAGYDGYDGHIALRYYHTCNACYYTIGIDNLEVRTGAIGASSVYSVRSDGATVAWETVGPVGTVDLHIIHGDDTTTVSGVSSPYNITGLEPGEVYRYELDYGQCYPVGGSFVTMAEAVHANWCHDFETGYSNNRHAGWSYPVVYGTGSGDRYRGQYGIYLQSYSNNSTAAAMPYIEESDYTGLRLTFMAKQNGYGNTVIGLLADPRDTAGMVPLDTITERDNVWRSYEVDLTGHEQDGHHVVFFIANRQDLGCYTCNSYIDIDDMRLDRGNRIVERSYTSTATSADVAWTATDATDSVRVVLTLDGDAVYDSTAAAADSGCHIEGLQNGTAYTMTLEALSETTHGGCDPTPSTLLTLEHDMEDGYCERCEGSWSVLPEGWTWLADGGRQPWNDGSTDRFGRRRYTMALHADSRADAYTMVISPRMANGANGLVAGFGAWYSSEEGVEAGYIVAGIISDPTDASTFTALDTFRLTYFLQYFAVDLSAYSGTGRHLAFKGMSLDGYDRNIWLTDVTLSTCLPTRLRCTEVTSTGFTLRWDMVGSGDSVRIVIDGLADTTVGAAAGLCRFDELQPGATYTLRIIGTCQQQERECQWQSTQVTLLPAPMTVPACISLANGGSTQLPWSHRMPAGWTRPYGNSEPHYSDNDYLANIEFYAYRCNNASDRTSMAVSPYFPDGFAGTWLDFYYSNSYRNCCLIVGSMTDPWDTTTFAAHDTLGYSYPRQHVSLDLGSYGGHYLAFRFVATTACNSGYAHISTPSVMHCPLPDARLTHQEDTSVWVSWQGGDAVWIEYSMGGDFAFGQGQQRLLAETSPAVIGGLASAANYTFHVWPQCGTDTFHCNHNTLHLVTLHPPVTVPYCYNFEGIGSGGYPNEWNRWNPDGTTCSVTTSGGHDDGRSLHLVGGNGHNVTAIMPRLEPTTLCTDSLFLNFWCRVWNGQQATLVIGATDDLSDSTSFIPWDTLHLDNTWHHHTSILPRAALQAGRAAIRLLAGGDVLVDNLCLESCVAADVEITDITQHTATISWQGYGVDTLVVEYGRSGFAQGTGEVVYLTTSPYTITGLAASSDYNFIFRTICSCPTSSGSVYPAGGGTGGSTWWDGLHIVPYAWIDTTQYPGYGGWGVGYGGGSGGGVGTGGGLAVGTETQAEMLETPYCEDFDTTDIRVVPAGWRRIGGSTAGYPQVVRTPTLSGTRSMDFYTTTGYSNHLALPPVEDPSQLVMAFSVYSTNDEPINRNYGVFTVGVMTDPDKGSTFVPIDTVNLNASNRWEQHFVDLSTYSGSGQYIAFRFTPRYSSYHLYLEDVYLGSCAVTSATAAVTPTGTTLAFTTIGAASGVLVDDTAGYHAALTATGQVLPELDAAGHYTFTVRAYSDSDTQGVCHLAPVVVNPVMQLPYCENFDAVSGMYPDGWTLKWRRGDNHTVAASGYMQFSMDPSNPDVFLLPPLPSGETLGGLTISYDFHANANTTWNSTYSYIDFGYLTDTSNWNTFVTLATGHTDAITGHITLTLPASSASRLALRARSSYDWHVYDIDNLVITRSPMPTSADITSPEVGYARKRLEWDADALASHWQYEWGPAGFAPGSGQTATSDSCSLTLTGLLPGTDYDIYFIDPEGHYSCAPYRFVTSEPMALPYCEQFDAYGSGGSCRPTGWSWNIPGDTYMYCTSDWNWSLLLYSYYYNSSYVYAILPEMDTVDLRRLSMHLRYQYRDYVCVAEVGVMTSRSDISSFTVVDTLPCNINSWTEHTLNLASYGGDGRFLAIRLKGNQYQYNYLYIDRLEVQPAPMPDYLATSSHSILAITPDDIADPDYYIEVCRSGEAQGLGRTLHVTTRHFTIDGLDPATAYDIYSRATSDAPACFYRTVTTATEMALPYCEDFNAYGDCYNCRPQEWTYSTAGDDQNYTVSGNNWSLRFYSYYSNTHYVYASLPDFDVSDIGSLSFELRYRFENSVALAEVGLVRSPGEWGTFVPIDTLAATATNMWYTLRRSLADDTTGYRFVAIRMLGSQNQYNYLYIDYLRIQACPLAHIGLAGYNTIRVATDDTGGTDYWVHLTDGAAVDSMIHIVSNPHLITGLATNTSYTLSAQCDSATPSCFPPVTITTGELHPMPYCEQFDSYGSGNGNYPTGWTHLTATPDDLIYTTSGNNWSLYFRSYYYNQNTLTAVLPDLDIDSLRHASIELRYRFEGNSCPSYIGIQTDPNDTTTFTPLQQLQTTLNTWHTDRISLSDYTGDGRFLAIRMQGNNTYYKHLYIDYIYVQDMPLVHFALPEATAIAAEVDSTMQADYWLHYSPLPGGVPSLTVADGTATNGYVPVYGYYTDNYLRCQIIYPATMLAAMTGGSIERLTFYSSSTNITWNNTSFRVNLAEVPESSFSTTAWHNAATTQVYSGQLSIAGGQMTVDFAQPYAYGGGNLLVEVINDNPGSYQSASFYGTTMTGASLQGNGSSSVAAINPSQRNFLPRTRFGFTPPPGMDDMATHVHVTDNRFVIGDLAEGTPYYLLATPDSSIASCWEWTELTTSRLQATPYCEDFDHVTSSDTKLPAGWLGFNMGGSGYPRITHSYTYANSASTLLLNASSATRCYTVMPQLDVASLDGVGLSFQFQPHNPYHTSVGMVVGVMTDPYDTATFLPIDTVWNSAEGYQPHHVVLTLPPAEGSSANVPRYVAFMEHNMSGSNLDAYIDNITVTTCDLPVDASVTLTGANTVQIDGSASSTGFYVEYGPAGFTQGTGTFEHVDIMPHDIVLDYETAYDFYFNCSTDAPTCIAKQSVTTLAPPIELAHCEDFESYATNSMPADWLKLRKPEEYGNDCFVYSDQAHSGSRSLRFCSAYTERHPYAILPETSADSLAQLAVSFWMRNAHCDNFWLELGTMTNPYDESTFVPLRQFRNTENNTWQRQQAVLSGADIDARFLALRFSTNSGSWDWLYVDDLYLDTCGASDVQITAIESESVTLNWYQSGNPTITLDIIPIGDEPQQLSLQTTPPYTIEGLNPLTSYMIRFSSSCGATVDGYCNTDYTDSVRFFTPAGGSGCIDPTNLTADYVTCFTGSYRNPYSTTGMVDSGAASAASRHTVHYDPTERDPRTGGLLATVPDGASASVRLGNWGTHKISNTEGGEAEAITYALYIDTMAFDLLIMRYAAVMQDPMHAPTDQPRFRLELLDTAMNLIDPLCGAADFIANQNLGWNTYGEDILWKDWTTVGLDMSAYAGQTVYIRLTTYDCNEGSHYGYAYFTLDCMRKSMTAEGCGNVASNVFTAPQGFAYRWYSNQSNTTFSTAQSIDVASNNDITYYCDSRSSTTMPATSP